MVRLKEKGYFAIVLSSSEVNEVMAISDRIVTMREGRVTGTMPGDRATEESLMHLMAIEQGAPGAAIAGEGRI